MSIEPILTALLDVAANVAVLQEATATELAPLLARPRTWILVQSRQRLYEDRKGMNRRPYHAREINRTFGDLVICRGELVRARLRLAVLLEEADAAPLEVAPPSFRDDHYVTLKNAETCAFFALLTNASHLDEVRLSAWDKVKYRGYSIPPSFFERCGVCGEDDATSVLQTLAHVKKTLDALCTTMERLPAKRAHVQAFESEWKEGDGRTKKARKDVQ